MHAVCTAQYGEHKKSIKFGPIRWRVKGAVV